MLGSEEYIRRAEELESRARNTEDGQLRAELLKVAEGWRDLARRGQEEPPADEDA